MAPSPHLELAAPPQELVALAEPISQVVRSIAGVTGAQLCTCTVGDGRALPTVLLDVGPELSRELRSRLGGEAWTQLRATGATIPGLNVLVLPARDGAPDPPALIRIFP